MHERLDLDLAPGIRLAVERRGEASRTVLLGHGGGQTRHAWERTAVNLADRGWRSVSYDLRGHGADVAPVREHMDAHPRDALEVGPLEQRI